MRTSFWTLSSCSGCIEYFLTYNYINESVNNFNKNWKVPKTYAYNGIPKKIRVWLLWTSHIVSHRVFIELVGYTFEPSTRGSPELASKILKNVMKSREKLSVGGVCWGHHPLKYSKHEPLDNDASWHYSKTQQLIWLNSLFQKTKILRNVWLFNGKANFFKVKMITWSANLTFCDNVSKFTSVSRYYNGTSEFFPYFQWCRKNRKYQGVKEFHMLARIGCNCKIMLFSPFITYYHSSKGNKWWCTF